MKIGQAIKELRIGPLAGANRKSGIHFNFMPPPISRNERHAIYKEALAEFDRIQASHGTSKLSFGLCTYFLLSGCSVNDLPEIIAHKPIDNTPTRFGGYWFPPNGPDAIKMRRDILLQAIQETE